MQLSKIGFGFAVSDFLDSSTIEESVRRMLKISVITVGKLKEPYWRDACGEYIKRLSKYCKIDEICINDEPIPDNPSDKQCEMVLEKEAVKIISKIPNSSYVFALCVEGKGIPTEEFAERISTLALNGISNIVFIIGGSLGLSEQVKKLANMKLSFSKMTFPHQMMRVILFEQIYRIFKINSGEVYHK